MHNFIPGQVIYLLVLLVLYSQAREYLNPYFGFNDMVKNSVLKTNEIVDISDDS